MSKTFRSSSWFLSAVMLSGTAVLPACSTAPQAPAAPQQAARPAQAQQPLGPPAWATDNRRIGHIDADAELGIQVHLRMRNEAEAAADLAAISDPDSPRYGQFLTDEEYNAKYAPTAADVAAVGAHLEANGLRVTFVPGNHAYVAATGSAAAVEHAFKAEIGLYNVNGKVKRAPNMALSLPAAVQSKVLTVLGVSSPVKMGPTAVHRGAMTQKAAIAAIRAKAGDQFQPNDTVPPDTCSEWFGQIPDTEDPPYPGYGPLTYLPCGYRSAHVRAAYGFSKLVHKGKDGRGQSVAIVDAYLSPTLLKDAMIYAANNDPDYPLDAKQFSAQMAPGTPTDPDTGWYGEQTLDVEAVHAIAPGAKIVYVGAQSSYDQDLIAAINLIVEKRLAHIVSNSYGMLEAGANVVAWRAIARQAGLKGIGLYFSSGDNGDESYGGWFPPSADFPASLDLVTAVGGTSLALGRAGDRLFEVGWETGASFLETPAATGDMAPSPATWDPAPPGYFVFGAGGGTSLIFDQPAYQKGVVPDEIANLPGAPARAVPDVAMLADPLTGFIIGQTDPSSGEYAEGAIGGTSLACPLFAGAMAIAEQNRKAHVGFANPVLYKAAKRGAFLDVAPADEPQAVALPGGVVATFDFPGQSIKTAVGWDNVTGLGVPDGDNFLKGVRVIKTK
jgi:subtilase family serine protease